MSDVERITPDDVDGAVDALDEAAELALKFIERFMLEKTPPVALLWAADYVQHFGESVGGVRPRSDVERRAACGALARLVLAKYKARNAEAVATSWMAAALASDGGGKAS